MFIIKKDFKVDIGTCRKVEEGADSIIIGLFYVYSRGVIMKSLEILIKNNNIVNTNA
jgi:hypothetical protein